jgi:cell wall-associated NlpC family hydrolase
MTLQYKHLEGRSFLAGVRDCFSHGRELYWDNFQIPITNYARPHDWSADSDDLIRKLHEREGFQLVTDWKFKDLRPADVLCVAIGESNPNHFAVYVGDNTLSHHLLWRFSNSEPYRDFWRNSTAFVLRHPDVPDLRPKFPDTDLRSLLNERYRVGAA